MVAFASITGRQLELDGLRGLAALTVFTTHLALLPASSFLDGLRLTPLHLFWDGAAAVDLFFVLSGFVLALPFVGNEKRQMHYGDFVIRRLFRILPAYWVSLLIALALRDLLYSPAGLQSLSAWSRELWSGPIRHVWSHVVLVGPWSDSEFLNPAKYSDGDTDSLNPVLWTLVVELRIAFIYPIVIWAIRRTRTLVAGSALWAATLALGAMVPVLWALPLFAFGGLLAKFHERVVPLIDRLAGAPLVLLVIAAAMLYDIRFSTGVYLDGGRVHVISAIGGALFILMALSRHGRFLTNALVQFLGRVSYSFFLLHLPMLIALTSVLIPLTRSPWLSGLIALAASLALSQIIYRLVEVPGQIVGRQLTRYYAQITSSRRASVEATPASPAP